MHCFSPTAFVFHEVFVNFVKSLCWCFLSADIVGFCPCTRVDHLKEMATGKAKKVGLSKKLDC